VTADQIRAALERQKNTGEKLGEALVGLGAATEDDIAAALCRQSGLPYLDATRYYISRDAFSLVPPEIALEHLIIPLDRIGSHLLLAMAGDVPEEVVADIERRSSLKAVMYISKASQILAALRRQAGQKIPRPVKPAAAI
jgi:type IV pilus assembly protein PilB